VVGNQVVVRGAAAIRVINALSGEVLGQAAFPTTLIDYLKGFSGDFDFGAEGANPEDFAWQGRIRRDDPASAGVSLPVTDLFAGSQYHTVFGHRLVVSLGAGGESAALPPPAPAAATAPR
jgi:hypothetical protein